MAPGVTGLKMTGTFDAATKAAVEAVQLRVGIAKDGVVGPDTWKVLVLG